MVDPKASRFWQAALQSGLIDAAALQACFDAIVPAKRVAEHIDRRLAKQPAQQVALGAEHAQQRGLVHHDVNPFNILVTREGVAKLTDLGLAIDQTEEAQVTREGATVGTFDYISPEQARHSHAVDTRSDIY